MMVGTKGLVIGPHSTVYMPARYMPASPIGDARRAGRSGGQLVIGMVLVSLWAVLVAGVVAMVRAARARSTRRTTSTGARFCPAS